MAKKKGLFAKLTGLSTEILEEFKHRDRGRDDILAEGVDGSALILEARGDVSQGPDETAEFFRNYARHIFVLQIQVGDRRPAYELTGSWLIPGYWKGREWIGWLQPGMTIPVKVIGDDQERVAVDWDAFEAAGGQKLVTDERQRTLDAQVAVETAQAMVQVADQLDERVAKGTMTADQAESQKRSMALSAVGELDDSPPMSASPREELEWQLKKGILDQATFDAIIANNPDLK